MLTREQIEARFDGIGGSEAASAAGLPDAYYTARELYHLKRREIEPREEHPLLAFLGNAIEAPLAQWYAQETGRRLRNVHKTRYHRDLPWMLAHADRVAVGEQKKNRRGLEIKMRAHTDGWGPAGTDQVPDPVMLQVQQYMEVYNYPLWDVIALFRGADVRTYTVPRDRTLADRVIDVEGEFWTRVQIGDPPDHDYEHRATNALIDKLHPATDGRVIELPAELLAWHDVLEDARTQIAMYDKAKDAAKNRIKHAMLDAAVGMFPDGSSYRRSERSRTYHNAQGEQRTHYMALSFHRPPKTR